ncbi:MAG: ABC transporter ATP-binding protein [Planctomycetota bacterium]
MLKNLWTLRRYYSRYRRGTLAGVLFLLACNLCQLALPFLGGRAVDALNQLREQGGLGALEYLGDFSKYTPALGILIVLAALAMAQITRAVFSFLQRTFIGRVSRRIESDLRVDFFAHLQELSPSYYDRVKTGDLMARSTNDLTAVHRALEGGVTAAFDTLFMFSGSLAIMLLFNSELTLYALIPVAVLPVFIMTFSRPIRRRFEKIQALFGDINTACQENFSGMRVIKAFVREEHEKAKFRELNRTYARKNISLAKIRSLFRPMLALLAGAAIVVVYWRGGREVVYGRMSLGDLFMFVQYVDGIIGPMMALGWLVVLFQQGGASMARMQKIFDVKPTIYDAPDVKTLSDARGAIEFRNLTFTYPGFERPALSNINLRMPEGSTTAVVGPAGCGKSTLASLIARLYEVGEGQLFIDGRDATKIPLSGLRSVIGFVPQVSFLFSESISDNIRYGAPETDAGLLRAAANVSQISADIKQFPEGYDQVLGERGINLSGGQKQRVTIARAIIRDPKILILDDALSSVDTHTEGRILRHLRGAAKRRTSIIISHRLSSVQHADNIVVLEDGRLTEQGQHKDLMNNGGFYAKTYQRQQLEESLEEM